MKPIKPMEPMKAPERWWPEMRPYRRWKHCFAEGGDSRDDLWCAKPGFPEARIRGWEHSVVALLSGRFVVNCL